MRGRVRLIAHGRIRASCWTTGICLLISPRRTTSTLFPYTTLFRSVAIGVILAANVLSTRLVPAIAALRDRTRSEEHTSELQSRQYLVCRLLLEKNNNPYRTRTNIIHGRITALGVRPVLLRRMVC